MVRKISGDPSVIRAPLRSPRAPSAPPPPARVIPRLAPQGENAWMAEIMFEAGFDPRNQASVSPSTLESGQMPGAKGFSRAELLSASTGDEAVAPGELPRNAAQYRALLSRLFDHKAEAAALAMREEPVLRSMREVWTPGRPEVNRHVATEFMRYFLPKVGEAYGFKPCPVEFDDTLSGGYNGLYDLRQDRVYLPQKVLAGTFADFVDVLVHEQMHCMQERLIGRVHLAKQGVPLTPDERAIATYWRNEQPKYRSAMANGSDMSPETRKRYREIGQEYHSIQTGSFFSAALTKG